MGEKCRFHVDVIAQHSEVTGSCFLLVIRVPGERMPIKGIIDCGLFQEKGYEELNQNFTFNAREVDFVCVTHAHMDHIGRIPKLVAEGYQGYIFCTEDTATLLPDALSNGHKVMKKNAKLRHQPKLVLYSEKDIEETVKKVVPMGYLKTVQIHENVKVTFLPNGHLVGASMILVEVYDYDNHYIRILFTGDYKQHNNFLENVKLPEEILKTRLTIVTEATYGATCSWDESEKIVFENNIKKAIMENKEIVVPAFALGRSQEILYVLKQMQDKGELPLNVPIYLDGNLAKQYTAYYEKGDLHLKQDMNNFLPKNFQCVDGDPKRNQLITDDKRKIIVTTSGMGKHGPAQFYIPNMLEKKNALIHFTGYCAEGTYGRILKETAENDEIMLGGLLVVKRAEVKFTSEYSSHAKSDEILELLQSFEKPFSVIINHGTKAAKESFAKNVKNNINTKKIGVIDNETIFRIGEYGIIKTIIPFK